jgi:hypothetical protein
LPNFVCYLPHSLLLSEMSFVRFGTFRVFVVQRLCFCIPDALYSGGAWPDGCLENSRWVCRCERPPKLGWALRCDVCVVLHIVFDCTARVCSMVRSPCGAARRFQHIFICVIMFTCTLNVGVYGLTRRCPSTVRPQLLPLWLHQQTL